MMIKTFTECLQGWERGSHGTGMGHTTNKGFWIPEKPVALPQEEMLALPEPPRGRGAGGRPPKKHRAPAAPKAAKGPGRQPKAIKLEETDQESQDEEPPVVCTRSSVLDHLGGRLVGVERHQHASQDTSLTVTHQ